MPFEDFVRVHARTVVAFFRQQGASLARAEDLAQEVFLKLYQSAERYEAKERFAAYYFRLARNVWIAVGYNFVGFHDEDFSRNRYTEQGPFIKLRIKADQDTFRDLAAKF